MAEDARNAVAVAVAEFMVRYSFELSGYAVEQWIQQWLAYYPSLWVRNAAIEALYQGRYKAVSISQILDLWQRRGRPLQHFNREFERIVAGQALPTWLGESAGSRGAVQPEPMLIVTDVSQPAMAANGLRHSSNRSVLVLPAPLQLSIWQQSTTTESNQRLPNMAQPRLASSAIQPFQPAKTVHLTRSGELRRASTPVPIQQFIPTVHPSELHGKLKAIAQALLLTQAQTVTTVLQTAKSAVPLTSESTMADAESAPESAPEQINELQPLDQAVEPTADDSASSA